MSYKWIFAVLKIEKVTTSLSAVKRFERYEVTLNKKVPFGRPRASTTKNDHRLQMTGLKDIKKSLLSTAKDSSFF